MQYGLAEFSYEKQVLNVYGEYCTNRLETLKNIEKFVQESFPGMYFRFLDKAGPNDQIKAFAATYMAEPMHYTIFVHYNVLRVLRDKRRIGEIKPGSTTIMMNEIEYDYVG